MGCALRWPNSFDFANLEELRLRARTDDVDPRSTSSLLRSVTSPCLRRVIVEVHEREIKYIQWPHLDGNLVDLVERHKVYGNPTLQISATVDPEEIRGLLPRATQKGVLEVRFSECPDYCYPCII